MFGNRSLFGGRVTAMATKAVFQESRAKLETVPKLLPPSSSFLFSLSLREEISGVMSFSPSLPLSSPFLSFSLPSFSCYVGFAAARRHCNQPVEKEKERKEGRIELAFRVVSRLR